jgi:hypothetical protein
LILSEVHMRGSNYFVNSTELACFKIPQTWRKTMLLNAIFYEIYKWRIRGNGLEQSFPMYTATPNTSFLQTKCLNAYMQVLGTKFRASKSRAHACAVTNYVLLSEDGVQLLGHVVLLVCVTIESLNFFISPPVKRINKNKWRQVSDWWILKPGGGGGGVSGY